MNRRIMVRKLLCVTESRNYFFLRTLFTALVTWCFVRLSKTSAQANSDARRAKPASINGIPGITGRTKPVSPTTTRVPPTVATTTHRSGWGSRFQFCLTQSQRVRMDGSLVENYNSREYFSQVNLMAKVVGQIRRSPIYKRRVKKVFGISKHLHKPI